MTNLTVFNFNDNQVRTQIDNGEPYFCLADVCRVLELKNSRMTTSVKDVKTFYTLTTKGKQNINYVNEPNLYRLIFRSNKPQAEKFADWVYSEVLPSIRKTGQFSLSDKPVLVAEHTRALPSPKKEIVLSEKAKSEIGGIVKAVVSSAIVEANQPTLFENQSPKDELRELMREVIREEFSSCVLKTVESASDKITADGLPIGNWLVGIVHGANAVGNCFNQMIARQNQAVKLLAK